MVRMLPRYRMLRFLGGVSLAIALVSRVWAGPCLKCKHSPVDMPVSLALGTTVRTPEFVVKDTNYDIVIRVNRGLPTGQMICMMGGSLHPSHCDKYHYDVVIEAEWTVWDGEQIVAQGTATGRNGDMAFASAFMDRYLGTFVGKTNKKYVVEVKFTKDGTPLNEYKPRLIVQMFGNIW